MSQSSGKQSVAVIDYGMGNLHSVASALQKVEPELEVWVTSDPDKILTADRVLFPGVGAIRDCMAEIKARHFDQCVKQVIASGRPLLAICVGLQALMSRSEENGGVDCLGVFDGQVRDFTGYDSFNCAVDEASPSGERLKVPHMGWNNVSQVIDHPLWHNIPDQARFYFVHSFCVQAEQAEAVAGRCHYGVDFSAALHRDNVFAVQFHPEKSHTHGLQLLQNFVRWNGQS